MSTPYDVNESLFDHERTLHFEQAIRETVTEGCVVVDAGSGTGVLGLLAAKHGASKVYCVEAQERFCNVIRKNATANHLADKIEVICADAITYDLPEKVDLIIAEVISGGFFFEPQIQIVNNLRRFLTPGGKIIPHKITTYAELVNAQEEIYGLKFSYDSRCVSLNDVPLSDKAAAHTADFNGPVTTKISLSSTVTGQEEGFANAVRISYSITLTPLLTITQPTTFLLRPEVIFLAERVKIDRGSKYRIEANYMAARDTLGVPFIVTKL